MAGGLTKNLAEAVHLILVNSGRTVFDDPQRFLAFLYDTADSHTNEMRVLKNNCDAQLLAPFRQADVMGADDLRRAIRLTENHLTQDCLINEATAHSIARGLAEGVARWRGVTLGPDETPTSGNGTRQTKTRQTKTQQTKKEPEPQQVPKKEPEPKQPPKARATGPQAAGSGQGGQTANGARPSSGAQGPAPAAAATPTPAPATKTNTTAPVSKAKGSGLSGGGLVALVVVGLLAFCAWRMFGWRMKLDDVSYVTKSVQTTLANGYVSSSTEYWHDLYGNLTKAEGSFETEDGDAFDTHESYSDYDDYGYPASHSSSYTVTAAGGEVTGGSETTEESDYRYDPSGRLHSKVVTTTQRYRHSDGEWGEPEVTKALYLYTYADDLPFGLARFWTAEQDSSYDSVTVMEYDKDLRIVHYTSDTTFSYGDTGHYESTTTYTSAGGTLQSSREVTSYSSGSYSTSSQVDSTYNDEGQVVSSTTVEDGQVTSQYSYEYDGNGNLVKRTNAVDGSVTTWTDTWIARGSIAVRSGIR